MLNKLEKVETKLETCSTVPSYIVAATRRLAAVLLRTTQTTPPPFVNTSYKLREVRIRVTDIQDKQALASRPNTDILSKINQHFSSLRAIRVCKLLSRDMVIQTNTREAKEALISKIQ